MKKFLDLNGLLYFWNKIKSYIDGLLATKVDKESGKGLSTNDYTTEEKQKLAGLQNYTLPKASSGTLGGVKVGAGLTIDGDGKLSATGGGEADSVNWENVVGKPTNVSEFENDSDYQTGEDVAQAIANKSDVGHKHTKSDITDFPDSMKNPNSLKVQLNGGTNEGVNQFTYDGEEAKNINVTPAGIGAANEEHTHTKSDIADMPTKLSEFQNDSKFITNAELEPYAKTENLPTNVSDLTNDAGYQNATQVNSAITSKDYQTSQQVETAITSKGYITSTAVDTKLNDYAKKADISTVYKYKGSVENYAALPVSEQQVGDTYNVKLADSEHGIKAGDNVSWNGEEWDPLAGTVDLSGYVEESDLVAISNGEIDGVVD